MSRRCKRVLAGVAVVAAVFLSATFLWLRLRKTHEESFIQRRMPGQRLPGATFSYQGGYVHAYETGSETNECPLHTLQLMKESVPITGGFITPGTECAMSTAFPYGRLAASSGSCSDGGTVEVYRCKRCVEINLDYLGWDPKEPFTDRN